MRRFGDPPMRTTLETAASAMHIGEAAIALLE
jgi:hypothetical protein